MTATDIQQLLGHAARLGLSVDIEYFAEGDHAVRLGPAVGHSQGPLHRAVRWMNRTASLWDSNYPDDGPLPGSPQTPEQWAAAARALMLVPAPARLSYDHHPDGGWTAESGDLTCVHSSLRDALNWLCDPSAK